MAKRTFNTLHIIIVLTFLLCIENSCKMEINKQYAPPKKIQDGLNISSLKVENINETKISELMDSIQKGVYPNIHCILIMRNGNLVFEQYFPGEDRIIGKRGTFYRHHHSDSLHDIRSISKSITGLAVLVALNKRHIKSLDSKILDYFPEFKKYNTGYKSEITIRHLLTMSDGQDWNEKKSYSDTTNSEIQMNWYVNDPIEFYFTKNSINKPGTVFNYSGGCTQVLAAIINKATGLSIDEFVKKEIFDPLEIKRFEWAKGKSGIPLAASGVRLTSRDLIKIGSLYLNNGTWSGKQIIPELLITEAQKTQITIEPGISYGFQIWLPTDEISGTSITTVEANGNGGQIIAVSKDFNSIIVITVGNYNRRDFTWESPDLYLKYLYPAMIK